MDSQPKLQLRCVIPNWQYYNQTILSGELNIDGSSIIEDDTLIDDYIATWNHSRNTHSATDLIGAAISNSVLHNQDVIQAAKFLEDNSTRLNYVQRSACRYIVNQTKEDASIFTENNNTDVYKKLKEVQDVNEKIHKLRLLIHLYPYNPLLYVDIARAYVSIGQNKKAETMLDIALYLDKNNRFVVRSVSRFYTHIGDFEKALYFLRMSKFHKSDPWLLSADLAINMINDKRSNLIKLGNQIVQANLGTPFYYTELASALGTIEHYYGTRKKCNLLFKQSLISPNENSLAQAEWTYRSALPSIYDKGNSIVRNDYEAQAYELIRQKNYHSAIEKIVDWICYMPFSCLPVLKGSLLAMSYLRDYKLAAAILNVGLKAHPYNCDFLNNLAYVSALDNKIEDAKHHMNVLESIPQSEISQTMHICMTATSGLIAFRAKNYPKGNDLYKDAIRQASVIKKSFPIYFYKATLNYLRERVLAKEITFAEARNELSSLNIPKEELFDEANELYKDIDTLIS